MMRIIFDCDWCEEHFELEDDEVHGMKGVYKVESTHKVTDLLGYSFYTTPKKSNICQACYEDEYGAEKKLDYAPMINVASAQGKQESQSKEPEVQVQKNKKLLTKKNQFRPQDVLPKFKMPAGFRDQTMVDD